MAVDVAGVDPLIDGHRVRLRERALAVVPYRLIVLARGGVEDEPVLAGQQVLDDVGAVVAGHAVAGPIRLVVLGVGVHVYLSHARGLGVAGHPAGDGAGIAQQSVDVWRIGSGDHRDRVRGILVVLVPVPFTGVRKLPRVEAHRVVAGDQAVKGVVAVFVREGGPGVVSIRGVGGDGDPRDTAGLGQAGDLAGYGAPYCQFRVDARSRFTILQVDYTGGREVGLTIEPLRSVVRVGGDGGEAHLVVIRPDILEGVGPIRLRGRVPDPAAVVARVVEIDLYPLYAPGRVPPLDRPRDRTCLVHVGVYTGCLDSLGHQQGVARGDIGLFVVTLLHVASAPVKENHPVFPGGEAGYLVIAVGIGHRGRFGGEPPVVLLIVGIHRGVVEAQRKIFAGHLAGDGAAHLELDVDVRGGCTLRYRHRVGGAVAGLTVVPLRAVDTAVPGPELELVLARRTARDLVVAAGIGTDVARLRPVIIQVVCGD